MDEPNKHYIVYLYQDQKGRVRYVGKGSSAGRALSHSGESQNIEFRSWLQEKKFSVQYLGPYRDEDEALAVESAMITMLKDLGQPLFNKNCGNGPKLSPLGIPVDKSDRFSAPPLTMAEIGQATGGALIVLVNSYDLTKPDTDAVRNSIQGSWQVNKYIKEWQANNQDCPKAIVGIAGNKTRFIVGAFLIDTKRWGIPSDMSTKGKLWAIPLKESGNPDAFSLQGRHIDQIKFGRSRTEHFYWIDSKGQILHPPKDRK